MSRAKKDATYFVFPLVYGPHKGFVRVPLVARLRQGFVVFDFFSRPHKLFVRVHLGGKRDGFDS